MQLVLNNRFEDSYRFFPKGIPKLGPIHLIEIDKIFGTYGKKAVRLIFQGKTEFDEFELEEIVKFKKYLVEDKVPNKDKEVRDRLLK